MTRPTSARAHFTQAQQFFSTFLDPARELAVGAIVPEPLTGGLDGPGTTRVTYLYYCPLGCRGCFNQTELNGRTAARSSTTTDGRTPARWTPAALAELLLADQRADTCSFLGGEPLLQAPALAELLRLLQAGGRGTFVSTGFTWDEVQELRAAEPSVAALLASCDVLKTGRFVVGSAELLLWRGSSNQQVHFLTGRYDAAWRARVGEPERARGVLQYEGGTIHHVSNV